MGVPAGWRGRARSGAVGWVAGRSYREYGLGVGLAVLLVSGAFGGLGETPDAPPESVAPRTAVEVEPFTVSVERVRVGRDLGVGSVAKPKGRYLLVSARITARGDRSVGYGVLRDLVRLEGATGLVPPAHDGGPLPAPTEVPPTMVLSADDAELLGDLGPDLTYPVVLLFEQQASAPAPSEVTVVLRAHTWRRSNIEERMDWFDPAPAVRVRAAVTAFEPAPEPSPEPSPGGSAG